MTRENLVAQVPADLLLKCRAIDPTLTDRAITSVVRLANDTGWFAIPEWDAARVLTEACTEFIQKEGCRA